MVLESRPVIVAPVDVELGAVQVLQVPVVDFLYCNVYAKDAAVPLWAFHAKVTELVVDDVARKFTGAIGAVVPTVVATGESPAEFLAVSRKL